MCSPGMTRKEAVDVLKVFNWQAARLLQSSFLQTTVEKGQKLTMSSAVGEPLTIARIGPDGESVDAFVLRFRLFIQKNDPCSFDKLRRAYEVLPVGDAARDEVREFCRRFKNSRKAETGLTLFEESLTYGRIMSVVIYGGLAHLDPQLWPTYERWMESPAGQIVEHYFCAILSWALQGIVVLSQLNQETLAALGES